MLIQKFWNDDYKQLPIMLQAPTNIFCTILAKGHSLYKKLLESDKSVKQIQV